MPNYGYMSTKKTPEETRAEIRECFGKWGIDDFDILPKPKTDEAATVEWWLNGEKKRLTCRRFDSYRDNLRAILRILDPIRIAQERGLLEDMARAATAFLEAPKEASAKRPWWEVLGVMPQAPATVIKATYNALAKEMHPDAGGTDAQMAELNAAYEEAQLARAEA